MMIERQLKKEQGNPIEKDMGRAVRQAGCRKQGQGEIAGYSRLSHGIFGSSVLFISMLLGGSGPGGSGMGQE